MTDDLNKRYKAQRNQEPMVVDSTVTGNHPAGNYRQGDATLDEKAERIRATGLAWIDQEDHAKQGMTRKGNPETAQAAPGHPHIGPLEGER